MLDAIGRQLNSGLRMLWHQLNPANEQFCTVLQGQMSEHRVVQTVRGIERREVV